MSVALTKVTRAPAARQMSLFDAPDQAAQEKAERLDKAVSAIRNRFGFDAIQRASLVGSDFGVARKFKGRQDAARLLQQQKTDQDEPSDP